MKEVTAYESKNGNLFYTQIEALKDETTNYDEIRNVMDILSSNINEDVDDGEENDLFDNPAFIETHIELYTALYNHFDKVFSKQLPIE